MQVGMEVDDEQPNLANDGEDVNVEDESSILLQCRQIIDNTAQERVVDLAERLDISIPQCHEEVWIRSKYPCIKRQVADCFSNFGTEGVELLQSVITNLTNVNYRYREVNRLLVGAGLIDLDSDISIQSENFDDNDGNLSSDENEDEGGIGDDNNVLFLPVGDWSDELSESDHDDQPAELPDGEVGNVENVNPGEQLGDDISGDINIYSPKAALPTRIKSPNDVTDTREFSNAQEEELAASVLGVEIHLSR